MKLRHRITAAAVLLAEASLLAAFVVERNLEKRHLARVQIEEQDTSLRRVARVAQDAELQGNEVFLLNYLKVLKSSPEVAYAALVDESGAVRVHTAMFDGVPVIGKPWSGPPHQGPDRQVLVVDEGGRAVQDWSLPLMKGARPAGSVHVGFDEAVLRASVAADLAESRRPALWAALIFSALGWLGAALLARSLTAPIGALHEGAQKLGSGRLDYRIALKRQDELGELAAAFNRMAGELDRINKFKEQLMGSITHDLRAPLHAIKGHAELLLTDDKATDEERRESAQLIRDNASRMTGMTDDLTDLVKLQMGRLEISREAVDIRVSFDSVRRLLDVVAKRLNIRLEAEAAPGLATVPADPSHLLRVLTNLVSNALKFTPAGGQVRMQALAEPHHLKIVVSDTGTGIPPQKLATLFTRFMGSEGVKHAGTGLGTGLGLSICREIVEQHGGRIWAESKWREGTRVYFTLPYKEARCSDAC
jgi:signal transduction histidine kinase